MKVVHYKSDEAAKFTKVEGWLSRDGTFWPSSRPDAEHMARYCGSTHNDCRDCGVQISKHSVICEDCRDIKELEKYNSFPEAAWDGVSFVADYTGDAYYPDIEWLREQVQDGVELESLHLVLCKPNYPSTIDPYDHFVDDLPEDGEVPYELEQAFQALNDLISKSEPLSYSPDKVRVKLTDEQIKYIKGE